jgi:hypothetical protein
MIGLVALLVGCASAGPSRNVTRGDLLAEYTFADPMSFEQGAYEAVTLRVTTGVYRIEVRRGDNTLWWGQWGDTYDDVIIEVETEQITERNENAYGVMCRVRGTVGQPRTVEPEMLAIMAEATPEAESTAAAESTPEATAEATTEGTPDVQPTVSIPEIRATAAPNEGDGYLFLIQGTGSAAIMRARGRAVTPLVNWTQHDAIRTGRAKNTLRAICAGDYLAFYVNDQLVAQTTDSTFRSGQVGLAASAANPLGVRVEFDNLMIYRAQQG